MTAAWSLPSPGLPAEGVSLNSDHLLGSGRGGDILLTIVLPVSCLLGHNRALMNGLTPAEGSLLRSSPTRER